MSDAKAEARKAADAALGNALRAAADHIYWYDGADAAKFDGGPITIDEFAGGVKLADRFDLTEIANAAIDAYAAALEKTHELVPIHVLEMLVECTTKYQKTLITDADREWALRIARDLPALKPAAEPK